MFNSLRSCLKQFKFRTSVRTEYTGDFTKDFRCEKLVANALCKNEPQLKKIDGEKGDKLKGEFLELTEDEEKDIGVLDPTPKSMRVNSLAIIKRRSKMVTQQGSDNAGHWEVYFDTKETWENPLMGWTSTGDPFSSLRLKFFSREEALAFVRLRGWRYQIDEESSTRKRKFQPRQIYILNFHWSKRTRVSTK